MMTSSDDRRVYVTVRDPQKGTSRTITLRGPGINAARVIGLVLAAVREKRRKAG